MKLRLHEDPISAVPDSSEQYKKPVCLLFLKVKACIDSPRSNREIKPVTRAKVRQIASGRKTKAKINPAYRSVHYLDEGFEYHRDALKQWLLIKVRKNREIIRLPFLELSEARSIPQTETISKRNGVFS